MKVKVLIDFHDLKEDVIRKKGECFECSPERFAELQKKLLKGSIAEVSEKKKKDATE